MNINDSKYLFSFFYFSLDKKICMYECTFLLASFAFIFISINCFKRNKNLTLYTLVNNDKKETSF